MIDEAIKSFEKALEFAVKNFGPNDKISREYVDALITRFTKLEKVEEAEKLKKEFPAINESG